MVYFNLSNYLAFATFRHIEKKVGNSKFKEGLLEVDNNQITAWDYYRLSFNDEGSKISVSVDNNSDGGVKELSHLITELSVPSKYKSVVDRISFVKGERLTLDVVLRSYDNSQGRVSNKARIFNAVYHTAVKPILAATFELSQKK